jgi:hypothetical protein
MTWSRWRRYALALGSASLLLQTGSCVLDAQTQQALITLVVQTILQVVLSGYTGAPATTL